MTRTFLFYSSSFGRAGPDSTLLLAVVQQGASEHICPLAHRANKPSQDLSMLLTGCLTRVCAFAVTEPIHGGQHSGLTLICIVSSFELQLTCVRLHCQQSTLEILFLAILGVFKGNVSLRIETAKGGGNRGLIIQAFKPTQVLYSPETPIVGSGQQKETDVSHMFAVASLTSPQPRMTSKNLHHR